MDSGTLIMCDINKNKIAEAIDVATTCHDFDCNQIKIKDYDGTNTVSKKILKIVLSYIEQINYYTWKKIEN